MDKGELERALIGFPQEVEQLAVALADKLQIANGDLEEQLLDEELWASVDLLQNIGIKHHQLFDEVADRIQRGESHDAIKDCVREGRIAIGDWLFQRFKDIAVGKDPNASARRAFENYLRALQHICKQSHSELLVVEQHAALFAPAQGDRWWVLLTKRYKRLLKRSLGVRFTRKFSPETLTHFYLLVDLPKHLLAIANMVGEAEFFLLRRVKSLYEELATVYNLFLAEIDENQSDIDAEQLVGSARRVRDEIDESFKLVGAEVMKYYEDIRRALSREEDALLLRWIGDAAHRGAVGQGHALHVDDRVEKGYHRELDQRLSKWGGYLLGYAGVYTMELELARVQNELRHAIDETVLRINNRLRQRLQDECKPVQDALGNTLESLRQSTVGGSSAEEVRELVDTHRAVLLSSANVETQSRLRSIAGSGEINQLMDVLSERFRQLVDGTVENFQIIEIDDLPMREGFVPGDVPLKNAPMRAVVRTYIERELTHRLADVNQSMVAQVNAVLQSVDQLGQTVDFSLGTVSVELREVGKEPEELVGVALSRLRRAEEKLVDDLNKVEALNAEVEEKTIASVADVARRLRQMILDESVVEMQRQINRANGKNASGREDKVSATQPQGPQSQHREINSRSEEEYGRTAVLGYEAILDLHQQIDEKVPFAYRRLFRTAPLEVSDFLRGRSQALGAIENAVKRWSQGGFSAVALVGEQGSGKTSLINCAMEEKLQGIPIVRHRIRSSLLDTKQFLPLLKSLLDGRADDLEELQRELERSNTRRIIILEDVHQLYLRARGGLDLLRKLLEFIDATGGNVLWIVTIDQYAWQYLDHALSLSRHFAFLIETGRLSRGELEGAIMARHQATGYELYFLDEAGKRAQEQPAAREAFFNAMSSACAGNVFSAIYYWLHSVQTVDDNAVEIASLEELKLDFLRSLSVEGMLSLGMVIQHGSLAAEHYGAIFHMPLIEANARLAHLQRMGMLQQNTYDPEGREYSVNPLLYHPIVVELKRRNIVQ